LRDPKNLTDFFISRCDESALNVHTIHAETEGMGQFDIFMDLVGALKKRGATFVRLDEAAARLKGAELPVCEVTRTELEGRAGWVAGQGTGPPS
jgi:hypothetical protein